MINKTPLTGKELFEQIWAQQEAYEKEKASYVFQDALTHGLKEHLELEELRKLAEVVKDFVAYKARFNEIMACPKCRPIVQGMYIPCEDHKSDVTIDHLTEIKQSLERLEKIKRGEFRQ